MGQGDNQTDEELRRLRKGDAQGSGSPQGYVAPGGTREVPGDGDAPFSKSPPFPGLRDLLLSDTLPVLSYVETEEFDVERARLLTIWLEHVAGAADSIASVIAQVRQLPGDEWFSIGVINGTIAPVSLTPDASTCIFGSRDAYPAEFRTPAMPAGNVCRMTLTFDVGPYRQMRFLVGNAADIADGGTLELHGSKSD